MLVELIDEAPAALRRALGLVDGRGYAAAWLLARLRRDGGAEWVERRLYVVRDDGAVFGEGAERGLGELGFAVEMGEPARPRGTWRRAAFSLIRARRSAISGARELGSAAAARA